MTDAPEKMVSVPLELLRKVLDEFELETFGDSHVGYPESEKKAERMRSDIDEIRRIAGIDG